MLSELIADFRYLYLQTLYSQVPSNLVLFHYTY